MRLLWLPEVLRAAGLTVFEVSGWRTRGGESYDPRGIICHATAGSSTSTDAGEIRVLLEGSTSAPPPIAQLYLSRSGAFHVVASGRCNHALQGWGGPLEGYGNTHLIGIEAQNDNRGQAWTAAQLDSYERGVAAICRHMGWTPGRNVAAHREHQPGAKSDPVGIDMTRFRTRVAAILAGEDDDMPTAAEIADAVWTRPLGSPALDINTWATGDWLKRAEVAVRAVGSLGASLTAAIAALAAKDTVDEAALAAALAPGVAAAVVAQLPAGADQVSQEEVTNAVLAAFRQAFGATAQ